MGMKGEIMEIQDNFMIGSIDQMKSSDTSNNMQIDQAGFLRIMAASISNPSMSGGESGGGGGGHTDYMNQIAQFNMLDSLNEITSTIQNTMLMTQQQQALTLVGKDVTVAGDEAGFVSGTVEKVRFSNGYATIQVNGAEYGLNSILEVGVPSDAE